MEIFSSAETRSLIRAAFSNSSFADRDSISFVSVAINLLGSSERKLISSFVSWTWSDSEIFPTHGAAHLSMNPSKHGLPDLFAELKTPALHDLIGKDDCTKS